MDSSSVSYENDIDTALLQYFILSPRLQKERRVVQVMEISQRKGPETSARGSGKSQQKENVSEMYFVDLHYYSSLFFLPGCKRKGV